MQEVNLISVSQPSKKFIEETGCDTAEKLISYCARVSNPKNQQNFNTSEKLLKYCLDHRHWSPFEMVSVTMEIKTTRDIARQILRHRSFSFQEFSQRYAEVDVENFVIREARLQDKTNRQNSIEVDDVQLADGWAHWQKDLLQKIIGVYKWALVNNIAKEQARAILPEGMTPSTMYMNGTLRSWIHYCHLRMGEETQKEHRLVAQMCWNSLVAEFPVLEKMDWDIL